jgi:hypothetical protein
MQQLYYRHWGWQQRLLRTNGQRAAAEWQLRVPTENIRERLPL